MRPERERSMAMFHARVFVGGCRWVLPYAFLLMLVLVVNDVKDDAIVVVGVEDNY